MTDEKKAPPLGLNICASGFSMVPSFWTKLIRVKADRGIPASFWKFSLVLWHDTVGPNAAKKNFTFKGTMKDFGVRPANAMKWTAAYIASGLYIVEKGKRHTRQQHGEPSVYQYLNGSDYEWDVFIRSLSWLCRLDSQRHAGAEGTGGLLSFQAALTVLIATQKAKEKCPVLISENNKQFLRNCEKNGIIKRDTSKPADKFDSYWFARTPTNRMGVLDREGKIYYYQLDDNPDLDQADDAEEEHQKRNPDQFMGYGEGARVE